MCGLGESLEIKAEERGIQKGIEKGIEKGKIIQLIELVQSGVLPEETAARVAGMTVEEFKARMQEQVTLA